MPGEIITGVAGAGKTAYLIQRVLQAAEGWDEIWVVLPNRLQEDAFRERLIRAAPGAALFNVHFFGIYDLYARLLDIVGQPQRTLGRGAARRLLRSVIAGEHAAGRLAYYQRIAQMPGFVGLVGDFIQELKQGVVRHEPFGHFAQTQGPKDQDIARIYAAYQELLIAHRLADRDGAGWVALDALNAQRGLLGSVGLLAVDGFDQFTPLQARLLSAIAREVRAACVMALDDGTAPTRALTIDRLRATDPDAWHESPLPPQPSDRAPGLQHLTAQLIAPGPTPQPAEGALRGIEAPDPTSEARAVMRAIKRLLHDEAAQPDAILIVAREPATYASALRGAARAYGVPLVVRYDDPASENPAVRSLLAMLDLPAADFPRRALLDVLNSPYFEIPHLTRANIDHLERLSMAQAIVRGADAWLSALRRDIRPAEDDRAEVGFEAAPELAEALGAFFARITPPAQATPADYITWLEDLLGPDPLSLADDAADDTMPEPSAPDHLNFYGALRAGTPQTVARDVGAMHAWRAALADLLASGELAARFAPDGTPQAIPWAIFRADLDLALREQSGSVMRARLGRVLATSVFEARGLPHDVVFVLGLAEGSFPAQQPDDPLYSERERTTFAEAGLAVEQARYRNRDAALFYQMAALARRQLVLSRPTVDEGGNPWSPSIFWERAFAALPGAEIERLALGASAGVADAANPRELAVAVARALNEADIAPNITQAAAYVRHSPLGWRIWHGRRVELARERADAPFDGHSGILSHPALLAEVGRRLGPSHRWSATQFNDLGLCGFRYFSKRLLGLEAYEEPEDGLTVLQIGNIYHKVLEQTYAEIQAREMTITLENLDVALVILEERAAQVFDNAPGEYGFQAAGLWEQQQHDMLEKMRAVLRLDFSPDSPVNQLAAGPRQTFAVEAPFGYEGQPAVVIDGPAGPLLARGYIDRLDISGDAVIVLDYKSGSTPRTADMAEGRNYQMLLYLLAAEQALAQNGYAGYRVAGGLFWGITRNKADGRIRYPDEAVEQARAHLHEAVTAARRGIFANQPRKLAKGKCAHYCEFSRLCRVNRASTRKPVS
ncbi:MAG: PD-(D/E)XK nuclease family protein [Anaerolineales bacterium]